MSESVRVTSEYTLARTISGEIDLDITEQIEEAVRDGVLNCGGYDVEIQGGDPEYVEVFASGTVGVSIDGQYEIERHLEDEHDLDPYDVTIETTDVEPAWRNSMGVTLTYEASVESEESHEGEYALLDIAIDYRRVVADCVSAGGRESVDSLIETFMGSRFLEALKEGEI